MSRTATQWLEPQPPPRREGPSVTEWLLDHAVRYGITPEVEDLLVHRREQGRARYGIELCADNGRDALADQVQEAVDGLVYATQGLMETRNEAEERRAERRLRKWRDLLEMLLEGT